MQNQGLHKKGGEFTEFLCKATSDHRDDRRVALTRHGYRFARNLPPADADLDEVAGRDATRPFSISNFDDTGTPLNLLIPAFYAARSNLVRLQVAH